MDNYTQKGNNSIPFQRKKKHTSYANFYFHFFFSSFLQFDFVVCVFIGVVLFAIALPQRFTHSAYSMVAQYALICAAQKTELNKTRYVKLVYTNRPSSRSDTKLKLYSFRFIRLIILMRVADAVIVVAINVVDTATTTVLVVTISSDYFRLSLSLSVCVCVSSFCSQSRNYVSTSCIP